MNSLSTIDILENKKMVLHITAKNKDFEYLYYSLVNMFIKMRFRGKSKRILGFCSFDAERQPQYLCQVWDAENEILKRYIQKNIAKANVIVFCSYHQIYYQKSLFQINKLCNYPNWNGKLAFHEFHPTVFTRFDDWT